MATWAAGGMATRCRQPQVNHRGRPLAARGSRSGSVRCPPVWHPIRSNRISTPCGPWGKPGVRAPGDPGDPYQMNGVEGHQGSMWNTSRPLRHSCAEASAALKGLLGRKPCAPRFPELTEHCAPAVETIQAVPLRLAEPARPHPPEGGAPAMHTGACPAPPAPSRFCHPLLIPMFWSRCRALSSTGGKGQDAPW